MNDITAEKASTMVPLKIPAYRNIMGRLNIVAPSMLFRRARIVVEEEFFC